MALRGVTLDSLTHYPPRAIRSQAPSTQPAPEQESPLRIQRNAFHAYRAGASAQTHKPRG